MFSGTSPLFNCSLICSSCPLSPLILKIPSACKASLSVQATLHH
ncbi:hypothetical protein HanXRQr2_Chr04g0161031 [Helianthus annuus]|uniref:Uncharacterized protein n=1 Tax=Helianthus annuus TaxID=4232 RepID=A0A9K3NR41_HELAN|nr:hypothetical protein HanXRQr2_Chr04g0161031 [Helianthus annuus]KAJ0930911.1 hypothetical protein HanPSC8_Chr04g0155111 [Helianthus annuus]